jgi:hypothetical protein
MGANIAADIARGELSEATIGYSVLDNALLLQAIFEGPTFLITLVPDVVGAEMCGTLKNIVALAAGFVEGLGYGPNTKAAIMRAGLNEMRRFAKALYPTVRCLLRAELQPQRRLTLYLLAWRPASHGAFYAGVSCISQSGSTPRCPFPSTGTKRSLSRAAWPT